MFCGKCGRFIEDDEKKCPHCDMNAGEVNQTVSAGAGSNIYVNNNPYTGEVVKVTPYNNEYPYMNGMYTEDRRKSRITAGILQIFLGAFGVGRFYLGYTLMGLGQIGASLVSCGLAGFVWGIVDGVQILSEKVNYDAYKIPLKD